jgi:hypothetical protein
MRSTLALALAIVAAAPAIARADEIVAGTVIKIDHQEIYINLGSGRGLVDGAPLRLKRKLALKHPVTRAQVTDWLPLGAATITQAGERMSRAVVYDLVAAVKVGDIAEIYVDTEDAPAPAPAPEPDAPPAKPIDVATRDVVAVFAAQSGAPLDARIAAWERYQSAHPDSPFHAAIDDDLGELRALREQIAPVAAGIHAPAPAWVAHTAPTRASPDRDVPLVFVVGDPDEVASGWLHYRAAGARTYHRVLLRREHEAYLRGAIPADAVRTGAVEYFLEVTTPAGDGGAAVASPLEPNRISVDKPTIADRFSGPRGRTQLTLSMLYLDFANLDTRDGDRTDREVLAEVDVRYRLGGAVKALGAGYGVFSGKGGSDSVWTPGDPIPETGFNYGYAEVEVGSGGRLPVSFAARVMAGVGKTGFEVGFEGRGRIGDEAGTNLTATARNIAEIGFLSDLRLGTWPRPKVPIGVSVGALDQPAEGDLAVRLGIDAGYVIGPVAPTLRVSWQGRSIDHGGVGGGLALAFRW